MNQFDTKCEVKEMAYKLMSLPESTRERICFIIEGALLKQEADLKHKLNTDKKLN